MTAFYLIGQTPRAGEFNHRFIASPQYPFSEIDLRDKLIQVNQQFLQEKSSLVYGKDFIAVCVKRRQTSAGARQGDESLILVNPAIANYSSEQRDKVAQWLKSKLENNLDELVKKTDWEKEKFIGLVFKHPDIAKWENEIVDIFPDLLTVSSPKKISPLSKLTQLKIPSIPFNKIFIGMVLAFVLVFLTVLVSNLFWGDRKPDSPNKSENLVEKICSKLTSSQPKLFTEQTKCETEVKGLDTLLQKLEDFEKCPSEPEMNNDYCLITFFLENQQREELRKIYFPPHENMQALFKRRDALRELVRNFDQFFQQTKKGKPCEGQNDKKCEDDFDRISPLSKHIQPADYKQNFLTSVDVEHSEFLDKFFDFLKNPENEDVSARLPRQKEYCELLQQDKIWDSIKRVLPTEGKEEGRAAIDKIRNSLKAFLQCTQENYHDERTH